MRIVDLIEKKKQGQILSKEEINFLIKSLMDGTAHDYQLSAWLMAVYFKGLTEEETESEKNQDKIIEIKDGVRFYIGNYLVEFTKE